MLQHLKHSCSRGTKGAQNGDKVAETQAHNLIPYLGIDCITAIHTSMKCSGTPAVMRLQFDPRGMDSLNKYYHDFIKL